MIGIAPWYRHRSRLAGKSIRFLGSGVAYTDYLTILVEPANSGRVVTALADYLSAHRDTWDTLILERVDDKDRVIARFAQELSRQQFKLAHYRCESCWRIDLPASWTDYLSALKGSRRRQIRQLTRRFIDSGKVRWRQAETPLEIDQGLRHLADLNRRRLHSLGRRSSFETAEFESFIRAVARQFYRKGQLRLSWIEFCGQIAAVRMDVAGQQVLYSYQSAIEPELAKYRPGWLDMILTLQTALQEGFSSFDLLGGDDPYKARWGARERMKYSLFVSSPSIAGCYQRQLRKTVFTLNKLVRINARRGAPRISSPGQ